MCTKKSKYISLPPQEQICSQKDAACNYADIKTGFSKWQKCLIIFVQDNKKDDARLIIYKYFLFGICAGLSLDLGQFLLIILNMSLIYFRKPLIGVIYSLKNLKSLEVKKDSNNYELKLKTEQKQKLSLKFKGAQSAKWIGAIISQTNTNLSHSTHSPSLLQSNTKSESCEKSKKSGSDCGTKSSSKFASEKSEKKSES
ncbi:unnamed protein product [Caenorhabditis angaria]|uniref:PH-15 domain-containing protein n=1 Tax=Caenorhabditis angaria TaxID=860376 RepID=A0A9P1IQ51_9PELO|nr:unnamed protein product [Caenorhabditis angaria]